MAKNVGAYMSSHAPQIILQPRVSDEYIAQLAKVQGALMSVVERMRKKNVDTLIVFGSDHVETFFLDNYPQMLLFIGESSSAKFVDKEVSIQNDTELALHLLYNLLDQGFDVFFSQEMRLAHPFASPLY